MAICNSAKGSHFNGALVYLARVTGRAKPVMQAGSFRVDGEKTALKVYRRFLGLAAVVLAMLLLTVHSASAQHGCDPGNLIANCNMNNFVSYGGSGWRVPTGWTPFVVNGSADFRESTDTYWGAPSLEIWSSGTAFDAGTYTQVPGLSRGTRYKASAGWFAVSQRPNSVYCRKLGIDPNGGTDPTSSSVVWGPSYCGTNRIVNYPPPGANIDVSVIARAETVTVFAYVDLTNPSSDNHAFLDAVGLYQDDSSANDLGFRPNPDGYSFQNFGSNYPINGCDYCIQEAIKMFGQSAVCHMVDDVCIPARDALLWIAQENWRLRVGYCLGFSTTSLRFFKGPDDASDFEGNALFPYNLHINSVRKRLAYYSAFQHVEPANIAINAALMSTPQQVLNQLRSATSNGAPNPAVLIITNADPPEGHVLTPYSIEDRGGGTYRVFVYDSNSPGDASRWVEIDTTANTWHSNLEPDPGTWTGNATSHSLAAVPISTFVEPARCPWCTSNSTSKLSNGTSLLQVSMIGRGHLLITDNLGRRIGFSGGQVINEVPEAFASISFGGLGVSQEPVYSLPDTGTYSMTLYSQSPTGTEPVEVAQFGPGYAVSIGQISLSTSTQEHLSISSDGTQLTYGAQSPQAVTFTLARDNGNDGYEFRVTNAKIGAGQAVSLAAYMNQDKLAFSNAQASGGTYDFEMITVNDTGQHMFVHKGLTALTGDTHYLDFSAWDGAGAIVLEVDHGSDGSIDQTEPVENQIKRLYLPLILQN